MNRFDILLLGATGFTGKVAVKFLVELMQEPEYHGISWGVAGRSKDRLRDLLLELEDIGVDTSKISSVVCEITDEVSLKNATKKAKVLLNCTGPFAVLGQLVVNACLLSETHYIDISAETHHMLMTYIKFNKIAEEKQILIIPACAWASLPANTGIIYMEKHFKGVLAYVENYIEFDIPCCKILDLFHEHCLVHYGTWASLVYYLKMLPEYIELKHQTFPEALPSPPMEIQRSFIHRKNKRFWFPYPGPDNDVVEMSQRYLYCEKKQKTPIHYASYSTMPSLFHFILIPIMYLYYYLCHLKCFRQLLSRHPKFFTCGFINHNGPTEDTRRRLKFNFSLNGIGWDDHNGENTSPPNKSISIKVSGTDPGYQTTAVAVIISAVTLIQERSKMPSGGVVMPGAAFRDTSIIEKLTSNGIKYEVVENKSV